MAPEITTRTERIWLGEDGIVRVIMLPVARQTLADAEENVRVIGSLLPSGRRPPLLVDSRQLKSMTREARAYYASAETASIVSALAIIIGSPATRIMGNFFLTLSKPPLPSRIFTAEAAALAWLEEFMP